MAEPKAVAKRLNAVTCAAIEDYRRYRGDEKSARTKALAPGVTRRAHSWCVDLRGTVTDLVAAGLANEAWFRDAGECKELRFGGRRIELFKQYLESDSYEVSLRYTDSDKSQIEDDD